MKLFIKLFIVFILFMSIFLGIYYSSKNSPPVTELPTEEYTFLRLENCQENQENNCRIVAENEKEMISFKVDYRYRDLFSPRFKLTKRDDCISSIDFGNNRKMKDLCIKYFIKLK